MADIIGKCPPEPDELAGLDEAGFEAVELYLEPSHLDSYTTRQVVQTASPDVTVLHTPHVSLADSEYFDRTFELAASLDAFVVVHTTHVPLAETVAQVPVASNESYGYENHTHDGALDLEREVIDSGENLVLDVAHLYRNDPDHFREQFRRLTDSHSGAIAHVHLCDATAEDDHRQLGAGDIPLQTVVDWLRTDYEGSITLELLPDRQPTARDRFLTLAGSSLEDSSFHSLGCGGG